MSRPIYAIFVAGGSGTRMGSELPKQFLDLNGTPILQRSIERFLDAENDARVVTVLPESYIPMWRELCINRGAAFSQIIVRGGMTRFHSVQNALEKVPDGAVVAIHDGVRPLASVDLIRRMLDEISAPDGPRALIPVVPVVDTLRSTDPEKPTPDRSKLVAVQTPQLFLSETIKAAYRQPFDTAFTDDASVAERAGVPIATTPGERFNIKITTPEDLFLASAILKNS